MTLAKDMAKDKHIYSTGITYDRHLQSSKYFYSTDIWSTSTVQKETYEPMEQRIFYIWITLEGPTKSLTNYDDAFGANLKVKHLF